MSLEVVTKRTTVPDLRSRKNATPIVALTAYTTPMARLLDPHVDLLLVGDSLGMVLYGFETTLAVTTEMMIGHGQAVMRGSRRACVVVDLPFGSYQASPEQAYRTAARVLAETGCAAVKLEGGEEMAETIAFLTRRGIPVMGHVGLKPQEVMAEGGFRTHGRDQEEARQILRDAEAVTEAGCFSLVIEGTLEPVARRISNAVSVPTIGIGASAACDGQILVSEDLLGLFADFTPKFVQRYADLGPQIGAAVEAFAQDVRGRRFPGPQHLQGPSPRPVQAPLRLAPEEEG